MNTNPETQEIPTSDLKVGDIVVARKQNDSFLTFSQPLVVVEKTKFFVKFDALVSGPNAGRRPFWTCNPTRTNDITRIEI
jgi:hypothetical protein